MDAFLKDTGKA